MDRIELISALDELCWNARSYGHDDNGLDDGDYVETLDGPEIVHEGVVALADAIMRAFH